ncbi:MAG: DUF126 domain-containing protein [Nitratireductor sp.]
MSDAGDFEAEVLVPGLASGKCLRLDEPLSFWGGLDSNDGRIIDRWHPQHGCCVAGSILLMPAGRGSSSGSAVLAEAIRLGTGPAGIVLLKRDPIVIVGAAIAAELYSIGCPVLLAREEDWKSLCGAGELEIKAEGEMAKIQVAQRQNSDIG